MMAELFVFAGKSVQGVSDVVVRAHAAFVAAPRTVQETALALLGAIAMKSNLLEVKCIESIAATKQGVLPATLPSDLDLALGALVVLNDKLVVSLGNMTVCAEPELSEAIRVMRTTARRAKEAVIDASKGLGAITPKV